MIALDRNGFRHVEVRDAREQHGRPGSRRNLDSQFVVRLRIRTRTFAMPPPPPSPSTSYPLFSPHVTLSTQVSHSFSFPSLPYPPLSPEIFLPFSFSTLRVTSRLHQCISQIPSLNSKGWGKGVSHIKVTRCSSSRLWCKRSLI